MMSLKEAARLLGGDESGGQVLFPGIGHSRKDRSAALKFDPAAPEGFVVFSHCGDDPLQLRDYVRERLGLPAWSPGSSSSTTPRPRPTITPRRSPPEPSKPDPKAIDLWNRGDAIEGTLGEEYLRGRGITIEPPVTLRFLDPVRHPHRGIYLPCIAAALAEPGRPVHAVQLTFLNARRATKASISTPRVCIGKMAAGAVQLEWPDTEIGIAEGIETALSAMQLFDVPVWACLGAPRMPTIRIPDSVRVVRIFADTQQLAYCKALAPHSPDDELPF